jgi:membrane protease YdiL (CAAX protease family)
MRWGLRDVAIGLGLFVLVVVIANVVGASVPGLDFNAFQLITFVVGYGALLATLIVASRRRGLGTLGADFGFHFRWIDLAIGLGIGIAAKIATVFYGALAALLTGEPATSSNLSLSDDILWITLNGVLFAGIIAPIVEELFLRGLLLRVIRNRALRNFSEADATPSEVQRVKVRAAVLAIGLSSLVFMVLHLYQSSDPALLITLALGTLTLGVVNGVVVVVTGRLGAAITAHIFYNGSSVLLLIALQLAGVM